MLHCIRQGRRVFERFRVAFVTVGMLVEDAVAAADSGPAVASGIPGKAHAGGWIEQVALHAAHRHARRDPTLHDAIRKVCNGRRSSVRGKVCNRPIRIDDGLPGLVVRWVEVEGLVLFLAISAQHTYPQA